MSRNRTAVEIFHNMSYANSIINEAAMLRHAEQKVPCVVVGPTVPRRRGTFRPMSDNPEVPP